MTVRDYLPDKINEVADSWSDRVHELETRTPEDEDDLIRVQGLNMAVNIIYSLDLPELDEEIEEEDWC